MSALLLLLTGASAALAACPKLPAVPGVADMAKLFPAPGAVATLVPGDKEAQALYTAMVANSTYAAALAIKPRPLKNGSPDFTGVTSGTSNCWWSFDGCMSPKQPYLPPDVNSCKEPGTYGLSVDDGPVDAHCDLLALYKTENIRATFFYIGSNVLQFPAAGQEAHNAGHDICVHTWSHNYLTSLTNQQVFYELLYTKLAIKKIIGVTTRCWRPPFGDTDDRVRTIAHALELRAPHIWDADTDDWQIDEPNGAAIAAKSFDAVIANVSTTSGRLVLNHESSEKIVSLFIDRWSKIKSTFAHVLGDSTCNNVTSPYPEPIAYPDFASYVAGARADTMQTLKAVADPDAKIIWAGVDALLDSPTAPVKPSGTVGNSTTGKNTTTGTDPVVVIVAANGSIIDTKGAGGSLPSATPKPGSAARALAVPALGLLAALAASLRTLV